MGFDQKPMIDLRGICRTWSKPMIDLQGICRTWSKPMIDLQDTWEFGQNQ